MITGKRISPRKPHFFKPLLPGFHHELLIPISFLKYLNGQKCESGLLRSIQGDWLVKINGRRFEDGWTKFAEDHDLQVGDFLVFRHEGDMVFHIMVFDSSTCQKEYPPSDGKETDPIEVQNIRMEESVAKFKFNLYSNELCEVKWFKQQSLQDDFDRSERKAMGCRIAVQGHSSLYWTWMASVPHCQWHKGRRCFQV
ncbi:hypothetical protein F0562_011363 [Nyssa sinensis]|uniref:TF-B3 domain-containing protein n=1 Tax=Nyssa sinensis TaxID=561372 RepID=A0A5J5A3T1_9ASTE|nr:hypothetical protein F0562_011363 [Nyssa sinensis]